jgi:disulfide bond formation protein DsbB
MTAPWVDQRDAAVSATATGPGTAVFLWAALAFAVLTLAGSLWLSMGLGLKACALCFYQRTFVMAIVVVLGVGTLTGPRFRPVLSLLAMPLGVAGLGVAIGHVYLEITGKLECPAGLLDLGTAPQQSLAALLVLLVLINLDMVRGSGKGALPGLAVGAAVVLGGGLTWASMASAPPPPPAPTKPYESALDICRPPFRP